jgi:large subunit ribosomal protein L25
MAGERIKLEVKPREHLGTRESKRLRRNGFIPGVLYGSGIEPQAIAVPERELRRVLTGGHGLHAILDVVFEGTDKTHASILKEYQHDPLRGKLTHIDLQEVRLDQPIQAQVTVLLTGSENAPGVKEGGALSQVLREVNVEALPMEVPEHVELDVSGMSIGDSLRVSDLIRREGVTYLDDPDTVLASVALPTRVEEPEAEVAEGEEGEAAAEGEGEAPAEGEGEAPAADAGESGESSSEG